MTMMADGLEIESIDKSLQNRLSTVQVERKALREQLEYLDTRLKSMLSHIGPKPKESEEQLVETARRLEYEHATRPQSNSDERLFMREMDKLKKKRKELQDYLVAQAQIDDLKLRKKTVQQELRDSDKLQDDLFSALRRLKLSHSLHCQPHELSEITVEVSEEHIAKVIGRGGAGVRTMEDTYGVTIDTAKGSSSVRVMGLPDALLKVQQHIQNVMDTVTQSYTLTDPQIVCLLMDKAALLQQIQTEFSVRIDLSRSTRVCKITGFIHYVTAAYNRMNSLEASRFETSIDNSILSYLLNKAGEAIHALEDKYHVNIDAQRETMQLILVGLKQNIAAAMIEINDIINANRESEVKLEIDRHILFPVIVGPGGAYIKQYQKELSVNLKLNKEEDESTSLIIRGVHGKVNEALSYLEKVIANHNSHTLIIPVSSDYFPMIVGKKGAQINAIREKYPTVTIDTEGSTIRIHSEDAQLRNEVQAVIDDVIAKNQKLEIHTDDAMIIMLKGAKAADVRASIADLKVNMQLDSDLGTIVLKGYNSAIESASELVKQFIDANYSYDMSCYDEDLNMLSNGGDAAIIKDMEATYNVKIVVYRKSLALHVIGRQEDVSAAVKQMQHIVDGLCDTSKLVHVNQDDIGALIGKSGSRIKSFEEKHNVKIDNLRSRQMIRLRGESGCIQQAYRDIVSFLDGLKSNERVSVSEYNDLISACVERVKELYMVHAQYVETTSDIALTGNRLHVQMALKFLSDTIAQASTEELVLMPAHFEHVTKQQEKIRQSLQELGCTLSCTEDKAVVSGTPAVISKATAFVYRFVEGAFPLEVSIIPGDIQCLKRLHTHEFQYEVHQVAPGVMVTFDLPNSCLRLMGSGETVALATDFVWDAIAKTKGKFRIVPIPDDVVGFLEWNSKLSSVEKNNHVKLTLQKKNCRCIIDGEDGEGVEAAFSWLQEYFDRLLQENWSIVVNSELVGFIIGKQGSNIEKLRQETGANIDVDVKSRLVKVNGTPENVTAAKQRILSFIEEKQAENFVHKMNVPSAAVPVIIGQKGATIRDLRQAHGVQSIDIDRKTNAVSIRGRAEQCLAAAEAIKIMLKEEGVDVVEEPKKEEPVMESLTSTANSEKSTVRIPPGATPEMIARMQEKTLSKSALRRKKRQQRVESESSSVPRAVSESPSVSESVSATSSPSVSPAMTPPPIPQPTGPAAEMLSMLMESAKPAPRAPATKEVPARDAKVLSAGVAAPPKTEYFKSKSGFSIRID